MTKEAGLELKKARIAAKMPVFVIAQRCYTSERTVARWEDGEVEPSPDDVDRYAEAVGNTALWDRWMRMTFDSYVKRFPSAQNYELTVAVMRCRYELQDVLDLQGKVERDVIDGKIDDPALKAEYLRQIDEAFDALRNVREKLDQGARQ